MFSLIYSAIDMALPAFTAERRAAEGGGCGADAAGHLPRSIIISCPHGAQQQTRRTPLLRSF